MQRQDSRRHRSSTSRPLTSSGEAPYKSSTSDVASTPSTSIHSSHQSAIGLRSSSRSSSQARYKTPTYPTYGAFEPSLSSGETQREPHETGVPSSSRTSPRSSSKSAARSQREEYGSYQKSEGVADRTFRQSSTTSSSKVTSSKASDKVPSRAPRQTSRPPSAKYQVAASQPIYLGQGSSFYEPELDHAASSSRILGFERSHRQQSHDRQSSSSRPPPVSLHNHSRTQSSTRQPSLGRRPRDLSSSRDSFSSRGLSLGRQSSITTHSRQASTATGKDQSAFEERGRSRDPVNVVVGASFLNLDDDMEDDDDDPESPLQQNTTHRELPNTPAQAPSVGHSLESLVDRLLARPVSKADSAFINSFLCLYRKFSTPDCLLENFIGRFRAIGGHENDDLLQVDIRLRHLAILEKWISEYPSDLASKKLQSELAKFLSGLHRIPHYAANALQISRCADTRVPDRANELEWVNLGSTPPDIPKAVTRPSSKQGGQPAHHESDLDEPEVSGSSRASSGLQTHESSLTSVEDGGGNNGHRHLMRKEQWKTFMLISDRVIADQLTMMDWALLSNIKARDLVRHVSLSPEQRRRSRNMEHVGSMIGHFNHVALWVGHMILFREKPKHRALALEKFMRIAKKLRKSNNYSSLGAVIAGINGNAVHRLGLTRELVDPQVAKEFQKWDVLMSTHKGYGAYRLAFDNSPRERIPFLPVHRRDLIAAEEGNPTFLDDGKTRVNWKKFEIIGSILASITRSQDFPYRDLSPCREVQQLLTRTVIASSEDVSIVRFCRQRLSGRRQLTSTKELWERSVRLEESNGLNLEPKKKFAWLSR